MGPEVPGGHAELAPDVPAQLSQANMTASYQWVKELAFHMALGVGQHTNDKELSYYAMTPSLVEWEVGWNPPRPFWSG